MPVPLRLFPLFLAHAITLITYLYLRRYCLPGRPLLVANTEEDFQVVGGCISEEKLMIGAYKTCLCLVWFCWGITSQGLQSTMHPARDSDGQEAGVSLHIKNFVIQDYFPCFISSSYNEGRFESKAAWRDSRRIYLAVLGEFLFWCIMLSWSSIIAIMTMRFSE